MFNKLLGDFINGAISAHTSRIKNQDVSLKFFQNSFNITELELYKFALFQYDIPIIIKCGIVNNVEIIVPWANFQNDDVKITIDDIFILASFPGDDPSDFISDQDMYNIREHQLSAHYEFSKKFQNILKQISSQKLSQIVKRVMHSCSIKIKNLHARIELKSQSETKCHAFGFITSSIDIFTEKPSKGIPLIIEKSINFNDLAVYLDLDQEIVTYKSVIDFVSTMKKLSKIDNGHSFLLLPSLISAKMKTSTEQQSADIEITTDLNNISLSISKEQLPIILKTASNLKKFNQFMFLKKCKKIAEQIRQTPNINNIEVEETNNQNKNENDETSKDANEDQFNSCDDDFDPSFNWILFHVLAKKKNNSILDSFCDRVLYKNRYIKEWNKLFNKSTRPLSIVNMDHQLDYQTVIYFRSLADAIKALTIKLNYDEILRFVYLDPLLLIPSFASRFTVFASGIMMKIKYLDESAKFDSRILLKGPSFNYGKNNLHVGLESLDIVVKENKNKYDILKLISPQKNIISFDACFQRLSNGSIKISTEPIKFSIDLSRIFSLVSSLDLNFFNNLLNAFEKLKMGEINYLIDIDLKEMHFIPFYQDNVFFDFGFKSFKTHPNQMNSKEYLTTINNISFSHNNIYIFNNLNINSSTIHGILNVFIPYFQINLMKKDFEKLDELKRILQSASLLSQKIHFNLKNVKIELEGVDIHSDLLKNTISLGKLDVSYLENLYESELRCNFSKIEIGYMVIEYIIFKLRKEPNFIQSTLFVNQFFIKELNVNVNITYPFLKGTYNHIEKTMDVNLGLNSIEFHDKKAFANLNEIIEEIISLTTNKQDNKINTEVIDSFLRSTFSLLGKKELKLPKLNVTIHFISRPITFVYNDFCFFINIEWSLLLNPFKFTISIPSMKISYKNAKYFEIKNFSFVFSQNTKITITARQIDLYFTEKIIQKVKAQFLNNKHHIKKFSKYFNNDIPNIKINIESISLKIIKMFKKYSMKIPLSQLSVNINNKKDIDLSSIVSIECPDIGLETEQMNVTFAYKSKNDVKSIELQLLNQLRASFAPYSLKKIIDSENFFYVNQTGIDLNLIVDDTCFTIPNNSSYISSHFPINPKICFSSGKKKTYFDVSRLCGQQSIASSLNSGMILIWKTQSLLIFSSPIEILNTTGYSIKLLNDYFNNAVLMNNQSMFVAPEIESKVNFLDLSFLGTPIKVRANLLKQGVRISNEDLIFRLITERNPNTLVARITITAAVFIRSFFTEPLLFEFKTKTGIKQFSIYPSIKVPICIFDINTDKISFKLSSLNNTGIFGTSHYNMNISLSPGESTISLQDSKWSLKKSHYIRFRVSEELIKDNCIKIVDISAPIFVVNQLSIPAVLYPYDKDIKLLSEFNINHPPQEINMFKTYPKIPVFKFIHSPCLFAKEDEVSFLLSYPPTLKYTDKKFDVSRINTKELALLPTSKTDDKVMPLTFKVTHDQKISATIILKPYVIIFNNTDQVIQVDKKPVEKKHYLIVCSVSPSLDTVIVCSGLNIPINLENISDFSVTGPSLQFRIEFTISRQNGIKYITITTVDSLGLFAVINETDYDFIINQASMATRQYFVLPQSTFLFDLSDTRTECAIECCSEKVPTFTAQLDHPQEISPIKGTDELFYCVEIVGNSRYVCHLFQKTPKFENENFTGKNFLINIPSFSLKLLGNNSCEYCRVTLDNFIFHILCQDNKQSIAFSIQNVQIDDMNEFAVHPVVLHSSKKPFFNLSFMRPSCSTFIEYLIVTVMPVAANIDISFVIDMMQLFDINFKKIFSKKIFSDVKYHFLLLKILPIEVNFSFFTRTARQAHRFEQNARIPRLLSFVPAIENFLFQTKIIQRSELRCSKKDIFVFLADNIRSSLSSQWPRLIRSASIISSSIIRRNEQRIAHRVEEPKTKHRIDFLMNMTKEKECRRIDFVFSSFEADVCDDFVFVGDEGFKCEDILWVKIENNSKHVKMEVRSDFCRIIEIEFGSVKLADQFCNAVQNQIERKVTSKVFTIPY